MNTQHDDWDRPRCQICRAGRTGEIDLTRIEKLLADRSKLRAVAEKFNVSRDALWRHWQGVGTDRRNYLRMGRELSVDALRAATAEEKISTIDHLRIVRAGLHQLFKHAVDLSDHTGGASLAQALDRNIMHGAQIAGEWQPGPNVQNNVAIFNIPGMPTMIAGIARVLAPYPEARGAVIAYLRGKDEGVPALEVTNVAAAD
jgi:hypothetical protein